MKPFLEHHNLTVSDLDHVVKFFTTIFPEFYVRHEGIIEDQLEDGQVMKTRWAHVGTDESYVALQATPDESPFQHNKYNYFNHMGFVVEDVDETLSRLRSAGYEQVRIDDTHPHRKRAYAWVFDNNVLEFVEYYSNDNSERNDYTDGFN